MSAKSVVVLAVLVSFSMMLLFSCSDDSLVGSPQAGKGSMTSIQTNDPVIMRANAGTTADCVYVFAIGDEEKIAAVSVYESVTDLNFPLSIQQVDSIESGEIVEITRPDLVHEIVLFTFGENLLSGENVISTVGILSTDINILDDLSTSWSCIKCQYAPPDDPCHKVCDAKRGKDRYVNVEW